MSGGRWTCSDGESVEVEAAQVVSLLELVNTLKSHEWQIERQKKPSYCALSCPPVTCFLLLECSNGQEEEEIKVASRQRRRLRRLRRRRELSLTLTAGFGIYQTKCFNFRWQERDLANIARQCFAALDCTLFDQHPDYPRLPTCLLRVWREFLSQIYADRIFPHLTRFRKSCFQTMRNIQSSFVSYDLFPIIITFLIGDPRPPSDLFWQKP